MKVDRNFLVFVTLPMYKDNGEGTRKIVFELSDVEMIREDNDGVAWLVLRDAKYPFKLACSVDEALIAMRRANNL